MKRSLTLPMLAIFDAPDTASSCPRRESSTVAPQALALMNGDTALSQSQQFAARIAKLSGDNPDTSVDAGWRLAFGRPPLHATAKSVIHLFMQGGPSQVDTYDPKPLLNQLNGQHPPKSFGDEDFQNGKFKDLVILGSKRTFKKYGQGGLEISDLFPH